MKIEKYTGYDAQIYDGDDPAYAQSVGERMKEQFPGAEYQLISGDPSGLCQNVDGSDETKARAIEEWINSGG